MVLRPYQTDTIQAVEGEWEHGVKRTLAVLPTGSGKTVIFSNIASDMVRLGDRVLILAHRGELLEQAADKLMKVTGLGCAVEKAEQSCRDSWYRVVVGSVQTLCRQNRLEKFEPDYFKTIIVDEAHHVLSGSYTRILNHFSEAKVLGVTATPDRGDMRNLGEIFESLAYEYTLQRAIADGYLCRIKAVTIPLQLDMSNVGIQNGDYALNDLGNAIEPYLGQIAEKMVEYCSDRKTVVFLPLVRTSVKFRDILNAAGFRAAEVNGDSPDRDQILKDFEAGKYNVLCNAMLLTEGWDCPSVDCVIMLRPTKVRSLYSQCIGRGTRVYPGKEYLLVPDFLWHTERHNLCKPTCLLSREEAEAQKVEQMLEKADEPLDLVEAQEKGERDVQEEREKALAEQLETLRHRRSKEIDPIQYAMSVNIQDFVDYTPTFGWEAKPPTQKQLDMLERVGIETNGISCLGMASKLIDSVITRREAGLATPKQIKLLERYGFQKVGFWTFQDASGMISWIAENKWRVPYTVNPETYTPKDYASCMAAM